MIHHVELNKREEKDISKGIRRLDFTGGEPLLIVEHYQYLEWCVEQGYAENIYLDYITNGTVDLTDKIKNLWNNFKFVNMNISMDAYGKLAEYIRTGIDWEHSKKNILEYNEYFKSTNAFNVLAKTRHIEISPTISSYNVYYIDELFLWCEEQNIEVDFNILHTPYNSSIKYLPPFAKTEAIKKLNKYILKHNNDDYGGANTNDVKALINFINSSPDHASKTFSAMIKEQEKIYKLAHNKIMDYEKSFPEWWRILNE